MGFLKGIGKAFKSIGKAIGNVAKGVVKFAKSPLGQLAIQVGLSLVTGGVGGLVAKGAGLLSKLGSAGKLLSTFGGFASKFLGPAANLLSKAGLSGLTGFLSKAVNSGDLLKMVQSLMTARSQAPATDQTTNAMANENISQVAASTQAQQLMKQYPGLKKEDAAMMAAQESMQAYQRMIMTATSVMQAKHEANKAIIQNFRV